MASPSPIGSMVSRPAMYRGTVVSAVALPPSLPLPPPFGAFGLMACTFCSTCMENFRIR